MRSAQLPRALTSVIVLCRCAEVSAERGSRALSLPRLRAWLDRQRWIKLIETFHICATSFIQLLLGEGFRTRETLSGELPRGFLLHPPEAHVIRLRIFA